MADRKRKSAGKGSRRIRRLVNQRRIIRLAGVSFLGFGFLWSGMTRGVDNYPKRSTVERTQLSPIVPDAPLQIVRDVIDRSDVRSEAEDSDWDLPNLDHERVDYWVERFTTDKREDFERFLMRKGLYEEMILAKLEERQMPKDLIYLAMIESGFQAKAYSPASASGIWQFMAPTGLQYGLDINRAVDERNDPEKATDAALTYLARIHDRFGSWYLAAASYNTGPNRVGRIMREVTGSERGTEESYYEIWDRLPRETRDYVPLMIAAARISKDLDRYGFGDVEPYSPPKVKVVKAAPATPLEQIARKHGTTVAEIRKHNPHFKLDRTRNDMYSEVRVPEPLQIASR